MTSTRGSGPAQQGEAAPATTSSQPTRVAEKSSTPWWAANGWREALDLATAERHQVYAAGLHDGIELERYRREPEDDAVHRLAVHGVVQLLDVAERRERVERGERR